MSTKTSKFLGEMTDVEYTHWLAENTRTATEVEAAEGKRLRQRYLIDNGTWDPDCAYCRRYAPGSMMPSHTAMASCQSGRRNHCTCDTCF